MINKEKAIELRTQGLTYLEISKLLECSVDWCKVNLKGVPKKPKSTELKEIITDLVKRAKSKEGITSGCIRKETRKLYGNDFSKEQNELEIKNMKSIRDKVKTHKDSVIRPYWLIPECSREVYHAVLRKLQERDEREQEDIDEIRSMFGMDESYSDSIAYALLSMSSNGSKILKRSVVTEINRIGDIVDVLEERNTFKTRVVYDSDCAEVKSPIDLSDIEHLIY
jgi:hypothetical protein